MDTKQIDLLACPECNGKLKYEKNDQELICDSCQLAFPVQDGIPVMLIEEARKLTDKE